VARATDGAPVASIAAVGGTAGTITSVGVAISVDDGGATKVGLGEGADVLSATAVAAPGVGASVVDVGAWAPGVGAAGDMLQLASSTSIRTYSGLRRIELPFCIGANVMLRAASRPGTTDRQPHGTRSL
jgi:hypothetical protein